MAPPVRNTSASSMQSPPASAEATSVIILSPEFGQAEAQGQGGRKEQPGIGHQTRIVEGRID